MDKTVERRVIYKTFKGNPGSCPQCGQMLKKSSQSYMVATRTGGKIANFFVVGGDFGWFCASCPMVVLDKNELERVLKFSLPGWNAGKEISVLGMIDLNKVSDDKKHLPLGVTDNPVQLIRFTGQAKPESRNPSVKSKK